MKLLLAVLAASPLAAQTSEFVIRKGKDTVAIERFTREGGTLTSQIAQANGMRTEYVANLRRDASVEHVEMSRKGRQGPAVTMSFDFTDTLVRATVSAAGQSESMDVKTSVRPAPFLVVSFALLEQLVRTVHPAVGQSAKLMAVRLAAGDTAIVTVNRFHADSIALSMADLEVKLALSKAGDVTGGRHPAQDWTIERTAPAKP